MRRWTHYWLSIIPVQRYISKVYLFDTVIRVGGYNASFKFLKMLLFFMYLKPFTSYLKFLKILMLGMYEKIFDCIIKRVKSTSPVLITQRKFFWPIWPYLAVFVIYQMFNNFNFENFWKFSFCINLGFEKIYVLKYVKMLQFSSHCQCLSIYVDIFQNPIFETVKKLFISVACTKWLPINHNDQVFTCKNSYLRYKCAK